MSTILRENTYHLWVPIADSELMKAVEVDEATGDIIVKGVMSSDAKDEEDDSISPEGMDCSYFLEKGWIKYEHGNDPDQFIGEPLEVRVGQFEHPTRHTKVNGVYVKARLFKSREKTQQAVRAIEDLQKSQTKRTMGWSIEGNVKERCRKTGKILKSVLRNVVLTMNPVNTTTWVELEKSFAKSHELTIQMEDTEKSLGVEGMAEIAPQSLEGKKPTHDQPEDDPDWVELLRKFSAASAVKGSKLQKAVLSSNASDTALAAFLYAKNEVSYEAACQFADYVKERQAQIQALVKGYGGAEVGKLNNEELDEALELLKSQSESYDLEKGQNEESDADEDEEEQDGEDGEDEEESDDEQEDDDKGGFEKSFTNRSEENSRAIEVSEFLHSVVSEIGESVDSLTKSIGSLHGSQATTAKAVICLADLVKSLALKVDEENEELRKSLGEILNRPVGRRSVTSQREVQTISKGVAPDAQNLNGSEGAPRLTKSFIMNELVKAVELTEDPGLARQIARFDAGVPLAQLNLTPELRKSFGLN